MWGVILTFPKYADHNQIYELTTFERDAVNAIHSLVKAIGPSNCYIISLVKSQKEEKTRQKLLDMKFYEQTGFLEENILFVHSDIRGNNKSSQITELKITDHIDDHLSILNSIPDHVRKYWYKSDADTAKLEHERKKNQCEDNTLYPHFDSWTNLVKQIKSNLNGED